MPIWSFLRHGQSVANSEGWFAGLTDAPLTAKGEQQAHTAAPQVEALSFGRAYCSDLVRAHRTAQIVLHNSPLVADPTPLLRERGCGDWEGRPFEDFAEGTLELLHQWHGRPPQGESLHDLALRVLPFLVRADENGAASDNILRVAHGALMRCVIGLLDGTPREEIGNWKPGNCELVSREVPPGRWGTLLEDVGRETP